MDYFVEELEEQEKKVHPDVAKLKKAVGPAAAKVQSMPATPAEKDEMDRKKAKEMADEVGKAAGLDSAESPEDFEKRLKGALDEAEEDELDADEEGGLEVDMEDMEMEVEPELDADPAMISLDDFVQALEVAVAQVTGQPVDAEIADPMDDMGDDELDAELDDDEELPEETETLAETIYKQVLKKLSNRK